MQDSLDNQTLYLFNEGTLTQMYRHFGAQYVDLKKNTVRFAVWAPAAQRVSVVGDFNGWDPNKHPMRPLGSSGVHVAIIDHIEPGTLYKYFIENPAQGFIKEKADPLAFAMEIPPKTASVVTRLDYVWHDDEWINTRSKTSPMEKPISIYEVHVGSWRKHSDGMSLSYRELADQLINYVKDQGFTHVELLPIMEHPYYGSWGYQTTCYFAPSSRFGSPQDLMYFIDQCHQQGLGVILDWVPSHFATDDFGLAEFDGTHLYEHADPRQGIHPQWHSYLFNYGRNEVRSFLLSSAMFWLDYYHADGLRVDAVSSMLYLDFGRQAGEWIPNRYGGHENLEAISFLQQLNQAVHQRFPGVVMIAEESTAWPHVTSRPEDGGLGFDFKWDMGWMHDTLDYMSKDPIYRRYHHDKLTFRPMYALSERFILPLSHDEVVHGKGSLINKMAGDTWQKMANLRLLFAYMYATPGKKLLFMGAELAQWREWSHDRELDWFLLDDPYHKGIAHLVKDLNALYHQNPALFSLDYDERGFEWCDFGDRDGSVISFFRRGADQDLLCVFNFTPVPRHGYRLGVLQPEKWQEIFNTDSVYYGGSNLGNGGWVHSDDQSWQGRPYSLSLTLPPLGALFLKKVNAETG
ncbi:1,4-alpha-glucan branching protein GlgB [Sulfobacillus thermosulfidooxidans]|uniref:1,4-alpha-glucan branching protein GlgB n=1 Tax=Sulfobacillus thermosulfidooxidans TaxID=28034 RepID=UPI00096B75CA|nr:1,4-alpha-glucan branching protein GlgB [Sulfobacillus thermosulfidooxidans]OLZ09644.1 1,4-alpha-glucan branching enzyme [Sulfobacillus thermosulfidooxidans]OLZ16050.1 1,4-alpha-glucan branching enzyme [Sulfobacillus thermosulfidooxidans]OLZ18102.1 1,4-alpha-glucan branching enzyme [Sulfobacillus thermosulfidooxidans]